MNERDDGYVRGRVIYLFGLVFLVQTIYPVTEGGNLVWILLYQVLYMTLVVAGGLVAQDSPGHNRLLVALGVAWGIAGGVYAFYPTATWALLAGYVVIALFQMMVVRVLLIFIFSTERVNRDVIVAASTVYFLLGGIFVPLYGLLETVTFTWTGEHAFIDGVRGTPDVFPWQTFVYYSYVTLTTLGYGDILPQSMWARSLVSVQAIVGVLYLTIIMARLVGLYAAHEVEDGG
ncbi:MAG TPA: potassium channel family protein [Anaerolineae bacterium]|nr:potassium channel family protein [Anaerolineae bacterium]